jgi:hypothetical protein
MTADFEKYQEWLLYHRCYSRLRELAPGDHTESLIKVREREEAESRKFSLGSSPEKRASSSVSEQPPLKLGNLDRQCCVARFFKLKATNAECFLCRA